MNSPVICFCFLFVAGYVKTTTLEFVKTENVIYCIPTNDMLGWFSTEIGPTPIFQIMCLPTLRCNIAM